MSEITTKCCVDFARKQEEYKDTIPSQWKRRSKKKEGNTVVRLFELSRNNSLEEVTILENNGELSLGTGPTRDSSLYGRLKSNLVKVDLRPDFSTGELDCRATKDDFSGKTIFSLGEDGEDIIASGHRTSPLFGVLDWKEYGLGFFCGPQTSDGYLSDTFSLGTAEKLEELFDDFPKMDGFPLVEVWASENYHIINYIEGLTPKQAWEIVRKRLLRSGAVENG